MLIDCRELNNKQLMSCDLCIVGAGAAGITLARSFLNSGYSICLMESGGFKPSKRTQELYKGWIEFNEEPGVEAYLHSSRLRYFGGTTNHWAGLCRNLDSADFRKHEWIEHSGWPIDESDIKPYYSKAAETVEIEPFEDFDNEKKGCSDYRAFINSDDICWKTFHISPPTRFGRKYRKELVNAKNVRVCINANMLRVSLNKNGDAVKHITCGTLEGIRFNVSAKYFVLSTGGVENARMLLLSNDIQKSGIGNAHDQVGRYFMEHPHYPHAANVIFTSTPEKLTMYDRSKNKKSFSVLGFTDRTQEKHHMLNTAMHIVTPQHNSREVLDAGDVFSFFDTLRTGRSSSNGPHFAQVLIMSELNPDPNNRVYLDDDVDRLGLRRTRLKLKLTDQHITTITKSIRIFATELARVSNGRLRINFREDDPARRGYYFPANHHAGTTRMSENPKAGVVDRDCKVHGVSNLFVAGSSVFSTVGFANPTFTIVALALRLSDHIRQNIKRGLA